MSILAQGATYNTAMATVAGAIILLTAIFSQLVARGNRNLAGWGYAFIGTGGFLAVTGMHMTLTWPLKQIDGVFCCAVDNVTFGEPAAVFGILTFIAGIAIVRGQGIEDQGGKEFDAFRTLRPILYVAAIAGLGLIMVGIAGMHFGMWRPPDTEPIARLMAGQIWEPLMMMLLYMGSGFIAVLAPWANEHKWLGRIWTFLAWGIGILWIFLSLTVWYSHVGFFPFSLESGM